MADTEQRVQRLLTAAFINAAPSVVVLFPNAKTATPDGGWTLTQQDPRPAQLMRIIEATNSFAAVKATDGVDRHYDCTLITMPEADIALGDTFTQGGATFEVVGFMHDNGYEKRAMLVRHGG